MRYGTPAASSAASVGVERVERAAELGHRDDAGAAAGQIAATTSRFDRFTLSTSSAPALDGGANLLRIEGVDAHAHPGTHQLADRVGQIGKRTARRAADIDDVGPGGAERVGRRPQLAARQPRRVVDLGQDLDVVVAVVARGGDAAEVRGNLAQILRPLLHRHADVAGETPRDRPRTGRE